MKYNTDQINALIRNRRSIYPEMYSPEPVDDHIIQQMLENANWAPNHGMTQPWSFRVFTGQGLEKLGTFQSNLYKEITTAKNEFQEKKYEKLKTKPLQASHVISIGMRRNHKHKVPVIEEIEAVACAVQNMYLTAEAYGIGCYWGSGGITYYEEAKPFFGLEEEDQLLGFLYIGTIKGKKPDGKRKPIQQYVSWVRE